jgi:polyhydroxyalkanoate synthesis regulator phasin
MSERRAVDSAWQRVASVTGRGAESVVRTLVKQGEVAADRAERAIEDLLGFSEANRRAVVTLVRSETERAVARLGLVRQAEVDALRARVEQLERAAGGPSRGTGPPAAEADPATGAQP